MPRFSPIHFLSPFHSFPVSYPGVDNHCNTRNAVTAIRLSPIDSKANWGVLYNYRESIIIFRR